MEWLNYHHLLYFWTVAREGGLVPAGKVLHVSHPTLSAQIHKLEDTLGEKLFVKQGRRLALTETGKVVYRYAEEIFSLGSEMMETVKGRATGKPMRLNVGVAEALPKLIVRRLLEPALASPEPIKLVCYEDRYPRLLADLATHSLDIVLTDAPLPPGSSVKAFNHFLGECGIAFFGSPALARAHQRGFPKSLHEAPMLLPLEDSPLRRALNQWFAKLGVVPNVVAEFEDGALLNVFGSEGLGLFAGPAAVAEQIRAQYHVDLLGTTEAVTERFYAISVERRLRNSAVVAICEAARHELFGG